MRFAIQNPIENVVRIGVYSQQRRVPQTANFTTDIKLYVLDIKVRMGWKKSIDSHNPTCWLLSVKKFSRPQSSFKGFKPFVQYSSLLGHVQNFIREITFCVLLDLIGFVLAFCPYEKFVVRF